VCSRAIFEKTCEKLIDLIKFGFSDEVDNPALLEICYENIKNVNFNKSCKCKGLSNISKLFIAKRTCE
jgi:hypothetical protein